MDVNVTATPPPIAETPIRPAAPEGRAGWRRWQVVVPVGLAVVIAGILVYRSMAARRAKPAPPARAVPVVVALVKQGDVLVTLSGLGSVVPTDAVTIHSRVDGQLMAVKFREGQTVQKGATLTIEPCAEVRIQGGYGITVNGALKAEGTASQPIHVLADDATKPWSGIIFYGGTGSFSLSIIHSSPRHASTPTTRCGR